MKELIENFINSSDWILNLPYTEPYIIISILKELGNTNDFELDSNSWLQFI